MRKLVGFSGSDSDAQVRILPPQPASQSLTHTESDRARNTAISRYFPQVAPLSDSPGRAPRAGKAGGMGALPPLRGRTMDARVGVAARTGLAEATVKMHRGQAMRKMAATSVADLVKMAEILGDKLNSDVCRMSA
jgi:Bacterial regulatory proteins, luxR family